MAVEYVVYDAAGMIVLFGTGSPEYAELQVGDGETLLVGTAANDLTYYVVDEEIVERPTIPDLDNVPAGTQVIIDGEYHGICDDGSVVVTTDIPGAYDVRLQPPFPWQPYREVVVIT